MDKMVRKMVRMWRVKELDSDLLAHWEQSFMKGNKAICVASTKKYDDRKVCKRVEGGGGGGE